jgi:predicted DNA-binding protein YlxM (UPF0122 family)
MSKYGENPDILPELNLTAELQPSAEIALLRLAIDKALMRSQRELWYMYAYDKLRPSEIALKLKISRSAVSQRLKTIKRQLIKYCNTHRTAYNAIREAEIDSNDL